MQTLEMSYSLRSQAAQALIRSILNRDQRRRPTVSQVLANEFVVRYMMLVLTDMGLFDEIVQTLARITGMISFELRHLPLAPKHSESAEPQTGRRMLNTGAGTP